MKPLSPSSLSIPSLIGSEGRHRLILVADCVPCCRRAYVKISTKAEGVFSETQRARVGFRATYNVMSTIIVSGVLLM
ncbi:Piso0_000991 [Millerozyma farinosa CBS 7064]|uniref:Piso0_000991 protein n=1 Tax=Pichia sorbitophila (strain ATCC MYA-4447 / BCRC 22081 / CBS 7064 / NBRC 10061 / NRRL Y-12695) TaxID=559304 RepID=G8YS32_PICSO|nr:Piso0_000991 [Millerozyma farinosa CBS 7064]CCE78955.1 Piso0_000991 [Millerozyma farinosa CBS 7064]